MTIQIMPNGRVRVQQQDQEEELLIDFRPASWPRSAKLKFGQGSKKQGFLYECTVQRKLANLDILKLRGKIYVMRRFQGKVQVGTFLGRRRIVVMDEEDEDQEEDSGDELDEEYEDDIDPEGYDFEEEDDEASEEGGGGSDWKEEEED